MSVIAGTVLLDADAIEKARTTIVQVARRARRAGIDAQLLEHPRHGFVCIARTAFHERVILGDHEDLDWLLLEHTNLAPEVTR